MKRLFAILLLIATVTLYACGGVEPANESSEEASKEASSSESSTEETGDISEIELSDETTETSDEPVSEESEESVSSEPSESSEESKTESSETPSEPAESSEPTESSEPSEESSTDDPWGNEKPHDVNGFLVYHGRAMERFGGSSKSGVLCAEVFNKFKEKVGDGVKVYAMPIPTASAFYAPPGYESSMTNTEDCFYGLRDALVNVEFVDVLAAIRPHTDEDVYARTDHHWFARGAYYASQALLNKAGVPFDTLDTFAEYSFDGFLGSCYRSYNVSELKKYPETFYWYEPDREYTAHYFDQAMKKESRSGSIFSSANSYMKFISGDGYVVVIDTDVHNGRKLLVIKDSFGNALAPFLISGFEQVIMIDLRACEKNVLTMINEYGITDVALAISAFSVASSKRDNITRLTNIS